MAKSKKAGSTPGSVMRAFISEAHKVLWRQDLSNPGAKYREFEDRVSFYESVEGGNLGRFAAIITSAKEQPCLTHLFRKYDVSYYDPAPMNKPARCDKDTLPKVDGPTSKVAIDGKELTYQENLRWALQAAGKAIRTGISPMSCPNDSAYFLFRMAMENEMEFLSKINSAEMKWNDSQSRSNAAKRAGSRSIQEIEHMLEALEEENDSGTDSVEETTEVS